MRSLYNESFVQADNLVIEAFSGGFAITGEIVCLGNITIRVEKLVLVVDPGAMSVETSEYAYAASVRNRGVIVRYDNSDHHHSHPDRHHRHDCDWRTGEELGTAVWVGREKWPTLGEFVREIADWYWKHRDELPEPDAVPPLGSTSPRALFRRQG